MCCIDPDESIAKALERVHLEGRLDTHYEGILVQI